MSFLPLVVIPEAESDVDEAAVWYERQTEGLGIAFLDVVEEVFEKIRANPLQFPVIEQDVRRALLRRFPYGAFFRVRSGKIRILAVMHLARDPRRWQRRA